MRFDEKARENLEAAGRLLPNERSAYAWPNASASRAYYAAYLAVADRARQLGAEYTADREDYYRHDDLPADGIRWGILEPDAGDDLAWLRSLRIKADYREDQVSLEEASEAVEVASSLLSRLLGSA